MLTEKSDRPSFEQFRSSTCHKLKDLGDLPFITQLLESNQISAYYNRKWHPEALYLLAMLDYLSNLNAIPLCCTYNDLRNAKLTQPLSPSEVQLQCLGIVVGDDFEDDGVDLGSTAEVVGILHHGDGLTNVPAFQLVGAGAEDRKSVV